LTGATACSSDSSASGSSSSDTVSIQVSPITDVAPIYIAEKQGLFKKQGLNVKVTVGQGGAAIAAALQSGSADIGLMNYVSMINAMSHQLPISLVAEAVRGTPKNFGVVVAKNSSIKTPADLAGKKIGVISTGSNADLTTDVRLSELGVSPKSVTYVTVPKPNLLSSLSSGQVDGVVLNEPDTSSATAKGDRLVLDDIGGSTAGVAMGGYATSSKWASSHKDAIKRFRAALSAASKIAADDPSTVRAILPTYTDLSAEQAKTIVLPSYVAKTSTQQVQKVADQMLQFKFLTSALSVSDHVAP